MWAILTVVTVLALVHVMNESGQTITLGRSSPGLVASSPSSAR
jgi:L-lactate permease